MRVACDIEGVVANPHALFLSYYNETHDTDFTLRDMTSWEFPNKNFHISTDEFHKIIDEIWQKKWKEIPPTEEDLAYKISTISQIHEIDFVTCRASRSSEIKKWLKKQTIIYGQFVGVEGSTTKKAELEYDIFIDDSPKLANTLEMIGKPIFLYRRPWNEMIFGSYIHRVDNFNEVIGELEVMAYLKSKR